MYLKRVLIDYLGAIEKLNIDMPFTDSHLPKPLILVGKNGSGKTLLTTSIVDSLIQIKRSGFMSIPEVSDQKFYKAGKKDYIKINNEYSFVHIEYERDNGAPVKYDDIASLKPTQTRELLKHYNINFQADFNENGYSKTTSGDLKGVFEEELIIYFPVNRYHTPAWLVEKTDLRLNIIENYVGKNSDSLIKLDAINEIESWILDVILDKNLYETKTEIRKFYSNGSAGLILVNVPVLITIEGKNNRIVKVINQILETMLKVKDSNIVSARFGISSKEHGRKISIIIKKHEEDEEIIISPTFSHLSSGEAMLVALFCSIIKAHDNIKNSGDFELNNIKGLVIIDEIDLNLHIEYTKDVLPRLMFLFPKIQFVITTHSPFFLLGMKETYNDNYIILNMPNGEIISENEFDEINKAYSIFIENFESVKKNIASLESKLKQGNKPLVITEGKTDWRHIKNALATFQARGDFTDIDIDFHEFNDDSFSDSKLNAFLCNACIIKNERKIIGIFDRDEANGKSYSETKYTPMGNEVYALSIPQPEHRSYHDGICIEFMYKDDDLFKLNREGRRIYVSSEFNTSGRLLSDPTIGVLNNGKVKHYTAESKQKIIDSEVIDINSKSLAMSKGDFANSIINSEPPFDNVDIISFSALFETLREITSL